MKIKRLMCLMLMMCMPLSMMPLSVYAEETEPEASVMTVTEEADSTEAEVPAEGAEIQAVTAPTQLWVEPTETNGIPARIDLFKKSVRVNYTTTYIYQLYLPGNVNAENVKLSWDGDSQVTVDGTAYTSGNCPVPPVDTQKSYAFKNGNQTLDTLNLIVYQGSADVEPIFIDIDESQGTIAAMDGDHDHETECSGRVYFNNQWFDMPKIKGRGNYTWWQSQDKKAYNITLGSKTTFPGIDSASTKKWSILAEIADHSLLCNRSGFALAHALGVGQDTASADVYMNGEYQGCYMVTPKTDSFVTKNGFMIEQDNYEEPAGGDPQFTLDGLKEGSGSAGINRITVKKIGDNLLLNNGVVDESDENVAAVADNIRLWLQDAWDAIRSDTGYNSKGKYYTEYIDIESFAKMYLMHEYVKSYDICSGSILFHRDGTEDSDKLIAGPIWDLDNAMGSVQNNQNLGSVGDRRSGRGSFIPNITEYKTSIYKTIYTKHEDFRNEVLHQYNKNRDAFLAIESDTAAMISEIEASALMNHKKVNDITNYNNHKYSRATTLERGTEYQQDFLATTDSQTDWPNYAANLQTYIHARSLWFENTYYDPTYCAHTNLINPVWSWNDDCTAATVTFECENCGESVSFDGTITGSVLNADNTITFTAEYVLNDVTYTDTKTVNLFVVSFLKDEGVERVDVYYTQDYTQPSETDALQAVARDSTTGNPVIDGSGQVNFRIVLKDGYLLAENSPSAPAGTYKNLKKDPEGTQDILLCRMTKITGNTEITITTEKCEHTNVSNRQWTWNEYYSAAELSLDCADCGQTITIPGAVTSVLESDGKTITFTATAELNGIPYTDTKTHDAYTVTFETDEHITVNVFNTNDSAEPDETNVSSVIARNGESGNPVIDESAQVYYELIVDEGYIIDQVNVTGSYTSLEGPEDTGAENTYRITGVSEDLTVTVTAMEERYIELKAVSLTLTGNIGVNFSFDISSSEINDTYISFTLNGNTERFRAADTAEDENGWYRFSALAAAKEMRDPFTVRVENEAGDLKQFVSNGATIEGTFTYSVEQYFNSARKNHADDTNLMNLINAMDTYGKYAQIKFDHVTEGMEAPDALGAVDPADLEQFKPITNGSVTGITMSNISLSLETDTGVKAYFTIDADRSINDYVITADNAPVELTAAEGLENTYFAQLKGAAAADLDKPINIVITNNDETETQSITYYPLSYVRSILKNSASYDTEIVDVCKALYFYWVNTEAYFAAQQANR